MACDERAEVETRLLAPSGETQRQRVDVRSNDTPGTG